MTYRSKVLVLLTGMAVITTGAPLALLSWYFSGLLREQLGQQALTVAATTAMFVDGDLHRQVLESGDESHPAYVTLRDVIRRGRDANRTENFYVKYAYTLTASNVAPSLRFGLDVEEDRSSAAGIGEPYRTKLTNPFDVSKHQYDKVFTKDDWGEFLSANAPIKDSKGTVVAALGVDIDSSLVKRKIARVWEMAGLAFAGTLVVAVGIATWLSRRVTRPLNEIRRAANAIGLGDFGARALVDSKDEFGVVAETINSMAEGLEEKAVLRSAFERYVPYQVADSLVRSGDTPLVKGERRKVTVLFSDIRGFSKMAEGRRPEEVVSFLNRCCEVMSEVIERNGGILDKFVGDGMMATFGAPQEDAFQEEHAVEAALELRERLGALSEVAAVDNWGPIRMGFGINSGNAVVGSVGSSRHMEFTAIGDTVNCAAFLQDATKEFGVDILISEYTYNAVRGLFRTKKLGPLNLKGRADEMTVYAVEGRADREGSKSAPL